MDTSPAMPGADARAIELGFLTHLDQVGVARGRAAFNIRFIGHTESWRATDLPIFTLFDVYTLLGVTIEPYQSEVISA